MLSKEQIQQLSADLKIDQERIAREFYEILLLNEMSRYPWSQNLVFKGGTALRLAYNSPRFSDDLDFSIIDSFEANDIFEFAEVTAKKFGIRLKNKWEKKDTILIEFGITEAVLPQPFGLKVEILKRKNITIEIELKILRSPVSPLEVLFNVQTLESMREDKISAIKNRNEPRDLFDLWYISQKLNRPFSTDLDKFNPHKAKQVLHKYLPPNWHRVIDEIFKTAKKNK